MARRLDRQPVVAGGYRLDEGALLDDGCQCWRALGGFNLEVWFHGTMRALAQAGRLGATVTGMVAATELDTTAAYEGRGQATRQRQRTDTQGSGQESEVTVYGWKPIVWIDAGPKRPLAVTGVPIHAPAGLSRPALGAQGRTHQAGAARLHQAVVGRQWPGRDDGPGGNTVFLTKASVQQPWHPCDDEDDRRRIETCGLTEAQHQWDLGHPPQHTGRAVRVQVVFTGWRFARATAYPAARCARRWAGRGGDASASSSPAPRSSALPSAGTAACLAPKSPCWWASRAKTRRQASGHPRKCWPSTRSQHRTDPYIGTSVSIDRTTGPLFEGRIIII